MNISNKSNTALRLSFIIGYGASALPKLAKVVEEETVEHGFEGLVISDTTYEHHRNFVASSGGVFIYSHALPIGIEEDLRNSRIVVSVSRLHAHLSKGPKEVLRKAAVLFAVGGDKNFRELIHLMLRSLGRDVEVGEVEEIPWDGIYHPRMGMFKTVEEYLEKYPHKNKPLVGLIFHRTYMLYGNMAHVESVIEKLEEKGLGVLPVFTYGHTDPILGTPSKEDSIEKFFFSSKKPLVEAVVNLTMFFLLDHGNWVADSSVGFREVLGVEKLKKLNVPILQPTFSFYERVDEWIEDPRGVDYLSQVYTVIMPEVDGLIEPIYLAGSKMDSQGVSLYESYPPHAEYVAGRVKKWIELRRKPPSERKVAIVLINPPCKGLEASVGVGLGLDVPESVTRLLSKLREFGYTVGQDLPRSGKELVELILNRKAISEFRWTSVEEIVGKGGAAAFVDRDTYLKWFEELPSGVQKKMIEDWGHPVDVLSGRVRRELVGMVYEGKFVIPGLVFGNVFLTPQPKFGCAGSRCDGEVCRILHDPTVTPPHQWLAVYRWITRVFGADVIIHFGTHGYLEFRPGKGVGLSPSCWPEITLDDVPHLYVYVVSNPMEGVIAKRRGYATLVDHMYPPMAMAEVLEEVEDLLAQYSKAKQLGEFERAHVIYEKLLEKAKENNIPIGQGDPSEVVEGIHRYMEGVRNTQIDMGLHVFGYPPTDDGKLAEYAATAMAFDSPTGPSIRRVLAERLGLDYDELRSKPSEVSAFGLTNSELIQTLHRIAVSVLKRSLRSGLTSSELHERTLVDYIDEELKRAFGVGSNAGAGEG